MRTSILKRSILVCLLFCAVSCSWLKKPKLEAEVRIANNSIYVWNRGKQDWSGGEVFLNDRSLRIQKSFKTVKPGGFAQFPIREFKQGKKLVTNDLEVKFVWVNVEGYAPREFSFE